MPENKTSSSSLKVSIKHNFWFLDHVQFQKTCLLYSKRRKPNIFIDTTYRVIHNWPLTKKKIIACYAMCVISFKSIIHLCHKKHHY